MAEDLLSSVDTPLTTQRCEKSGKNYLTCDYNRDGDSFRSPWSNVYFPVIEDEAEAPHPSQHLRVLELFANDSFDIYRDLYYEGGISSVYLWDQDEENEVTESGNVGFAGVVLLQKTAESGKDNESGTWDSIHVFEITPKGGSQASYTITSTVILDLSSNAKDSAYLSGNLTRQTEKTIQYKDSLSHIANVGSLVEDVESKMRNMLQEVYFGKTKDILGDLRTTVEIGKRDEEVSKHGELIKGIQGM